MKQISTSKMTGRGVVILMAGMVGCLLGVVLRDVTLLLLSVSLFMLLMWAWVLGKWNLARLEVEAELPTRVHAGKGFDIVLRIQNHRSLMDAFQLRLGVDFPCGIHERADAGWLPSLTSTTMERRFSLPQRTYVLALPYMLSSGFPLGIFEMARGGQLKQSNVMLVYPRVIVPGELLAYGAMHEFSSLEVLAHGDSSGEPRGTRPWQAGDPAKKIHWPATARAQARGHVLQVRESDPPGFHAARWVVVFHSYGTDGALLREDRFERAIALLSGTLKFLLQRGMEVELRADFLAWNARPCSRMQEYLECLALFAQTQRAAGTEAHELDRALADLPVGASCIVISDIEPMLWQKNVKLPPRALVIDIRQAHFTKPKTRH